MALIKATLAAFLKKYLKHLGQKFKKTLGESDITMVHILPEINQVIKN